MLFFQIHFQAIEQSFGVGHNHSLDQIREKTRNEQARPGRPGLQAVYFGSV
jgi:hypothetical protein